MTNKHLDFWCETFLFKDVAREDVEALLQEIPIEKNRYQKGEIIYSPEDFEKRIGFVLSGKCRISRHTSNGTIPLNLLTKGDSFAITTIFSNREIFPTSATAINDSAVLFIAKNDIFQLISKSNQVSFNIMKFLTERIEFLNDKIAAFSSGSVEEKLANYILSLARKHGATEFEFNKKRSSEALNCGRASLYRAMDSLTHNGFIKFNDKKIYILDLEGLERILK